MYPVRSAMRVRESMVFLIAREWVEIRLGWVMRILQLQQRLR